MRPNPRLCWIVGLAAACTGGGPSDARQAEGSEPREPQTESGGPAPRIRAGEPPSGQIGEAGIESPPNGQCEARERALEPSEPTPLGFAVRDVLPLLDRGYSSTLAWPSAGTLAAGAFRARYSPTEPQGELTIEVRPLGGARLVSRAAPEEAPALVCAPTVEVDVEVHVASEQGALDERFDAVAVLETRSVATIMARLAADDLAGALRIEPGSARWLAELELTLNLSQAGSFGSMAVVLRELPEEAAPGEAPRRPPLWEAIPFAVFPADSDCANWDLTTDLQTVFEGFSGADLVAAVAAVPTIEVAWQQGAAQEIALVFEPEAAVCANVRSESGERALVGTLSLTRSDGAHYAASAQLLATAHGPSFEARLSYLDNLYRDAAALEVLAVPEVELTGVMDPVVWFNLRYSPSDEPPFGGSIALDASYWTEPPDCRADPPPQEGGNGGGCYGGILRVRTLVQGVVDDGSAP